MRTYEVFLKKAGVDPFVHAGSLNASDPEMAQIMAREAYTRRAEGMYMWLVDRNDLLEVPAEMIAPNADKPHRVHAGERVAEHRRSLRDAKTQS